MGTTFTRRGSNANDMAIRTIGVPMDLGADRRGVDMGPSALRYAGLATTLDSIGRSCTDAGDLSVSHAEERDPETRDPRAKYLDEIESVCGRLADEVADAVATNDLPLVLGGDHSIAIGSLVGKIGRAHV